MELNDAVQLGSAFVSGAAAGVGGVMKWLSSHLKSMRVEMTTRHEENSTKIRALKDEVWATKRDVDVLKNGHKHLMERLVSIDTKQDKQIDMLMDIAQRRHR